MGWALGQVGRTVAVGALVALSACGVGGDDDGEAVELEPIVGVEPCDLLDEATAAALTGGSVEPAAASTEGDVATCEFATAGGSAIAASLTIGPGDEDDLPTGSALARSLDLGDADAAVVVEEEAEVRVVYLVERVVVTVVVVPDDGEVTDELVDSVVDFAETTVGPVKESVERGGSDTTAPDEPTTTEADEPTTTTATTARPTTTTEVEPDAIELELGASTSATYGPGEELVYEFEAEEGDTVVIEVLALTDASIPEGGNPCVNIALYAPNGVLGLGGCFFAPPTGTPSNPIPLGSGRHLVTVAAGATSTGSVTFQLTPG